jgi:hypothetical protein
VRTEAVVYCQCGCRQEVPVVSAKSRQRRFINGHNGRRPEADRFWEKVRFSPDPNGCWVWVGAGSSGNGYGRFRSNSGYGRAHRWSYERARGPIASGLELDHLCRNHSCVRPDHLEAVLHQVNVKRTHRPWEKCPHGDAYRTRRDRGDRNCLVCSREYDRRRRGLKRAARRDHPEAKIENVEWVA